MKTCKLSDYNREVRRDAIMAKRRTYHEIADRPRRRPYVQYMTTRFAQVCGERQIARYARQLACGQIRFIEHGPRKPAEPVATATEKPKRKPRAKKVAMPTEA